MRLSLETGETSALTVGTDNCGPACHTDFFQSAAALRAGLTCPAIDRKGILEGPHITIGIAVVPDGTAALGNGELQHLLQGPQKPGCLQPGQTASLAPWVQSGPEQAFIGIDIANASQHFLIQ